MRYDRHTLSVPQLKPTFLRHSRLVSCFIDDYWHWCKSRGGGTWQAKSVEEPETRDDKERSLLASPIRSLNMLKKPILDGNGQLTCVELNALLALVSLVFGSWIMKALREIMWSCGLATVLIRERRLNSNFTLDLRYSSVILCFEQLLPKLRRVFLRSEPILKKYREAAEAAIKAPTVKLKMKLAAWNEALHSGVSLQKTPSFEGREAYEALETVTEWQPMPLIVKSRISNPRP